MYDDPAANVPPLPDAPGDPPAASEAHRRFLTCRWHKPADNGQPAYCTHREVLPMAGTNGFNPDSWCLDCAYFKLRRVPRREPFRGANDVTR